MEPRDLVPELDELASDWLDVADLAHMPSLHNFHQMAVCALDLVGIHFWTRDSQMFVRDGRRFLEYRSYPHLTMRIDGDRARDDPVPLVPVSGRAHRDPSRRGSSPPPSDSRSRSPGCSTRSAAATRPTLLGSSTSRSR